jgi:hypothetical protein
MAKGMILRMLEPYGLRWLLLEAVLAVPTHERQARTSCVVLRQDSLPTALFIDQMLSGPFDKCH